MVLGTVVTRRPDVRSRVRRPTPLPVEMETVVTNRPHVRSRFRQTGEPPWTWGPSCPASHMRGGQCVCLLNSYMQRGHRDRTRALASGIH